MIRQKKQESKEKKPAKVGKPVKPTGLAPEALLREAIERLARMEARLERIEAKQDALIAPLDTLLLTRLANLQSTPSPASPPILDVSL